MFRALVVALVALPLTAQADRLTAHPQDVPHLSGQAVPLSDMSSFCESRSQLLLHAQHLPGPGAVLLGIEFHAQIGGTVTYQSLAVTVSPVSPAATRWATFAANLPMPTTIVQVANQSLSWTGTTWQRFVATAPYVHDGISNLTIDIQKNAIPNLGNGVATGMFRPDLETMLVAFGGPGSGSSQASTAAWQVLPIDVRLWWSNAAPCSRLRSAIPTTGGHGFGIGTSLDHVVTATPGSLAVLAGDLQWSSPITLPFATGQWWVQGVSLGLDVVGGNGEAVRTYPIPLLPAFVGQQIAYQALVLDAQTGQLQWTNGSDFLLGP